MSTTPRIALVAGASGLVGGYLIQALLEAPDYSRVFALTRRPSGASIPNSPTASWCSSAWPNNSRDWPPTTRSAASARRSRRPARRKHFAKRTSTRCCCSRRRRARRGRDAFRRWCPRWGRAPSSKKFYLRTKGEMEDAVTAMGFPSVDILQPSLLLGPRKQSRPLELLGGLFAPLINPLLTGSREALRAIPAETVARGMVGAARRGGRGIYRYTHAGDPPAGGAQARPAGSRRNPPKRRLPERGAAATVTRPHICAALHSVKSRSSPGKRSTSLQGCNAPLGCE